MNQRPLSSTTAPVPASRPDLSERDLVARIRAGDAAAFGALYKEHFAALAGFVLSYVRDAAVAEELVQDVFCAVWRKRAEWEPAGRVRHYLLAAARNRAITHLRHRRIVTDTARRWIGPAGRDDEPPGMGKAFARPDREAELADLAEACRHAIHMLPERRRLVVTLRWQHQMTHAEIAHAMGISVKGVEVQLSRALKSLRTHLERFNR